MIYTLCRSFFRSQGKLEKAVAAAGLGMPVEKAVAAAVAAASEAPAVEKAPTAAPVSEAPAVEKAPTAAPVAEAPAVEKALLFLGRYGRKKIDATSKTI